mmetsp:Transcript_139072/g.259315  ORF Transcript_139072/g.259315 Transcript_139072/m.259315 type:complete len:119 (-) Transcript_139072:1829-2185(-)
MPRDLSRARASDSRAPPVTQHWRSPVLLGGALVLPVVQVRLTMTVRTLDARVVPVAGPAPPARLVLSARPSLATPAPALPEQSLAAALHAEPTEPSEPIEPTALQLQAAAAAEIVEPE